jgi:D-sedoheptulose 7-phosphate isomerase
MQPIICRVASTGFALAPEVSEQRALHAVPNGAARVIDFPPGRCENAREFSRFLPKADIVDSSPDSVLLRQVHSLFERSVALKQHVVRHQADTIVQIAHRLAHAVDGGGKILLCGNGGSAADAQHLAAEMLVKLRPHVNRAALPALSLATDMSSITACANDYSYDSYFERMVQALGKPGDVLIGITTSGKSESVNRALLAARQAQMSTVGLLGGDGEPALSACDIALVVPSTETGRVQEVHITVGHAILEIVEELWLRRAAGSQPS